MEIFKYQRLLSMFMRFPEIDINEQNYSAIAKKLKVLSNELHLKTILVLELGPKNNEEVFEILKKENLVKFPASSYKILEQLVSMGIIKKEYLKDKRKFIYSL